MRSFLLDERGLVGASLLPVTVSQGNSAPIAFPDSLEVPRGSNPVSVPVLVNDIDPEGESLTLVTAYAALGTAVAEPDGTVTYTPPAGIPPGVVEFDTVVYEIADIEDARTTGQIDVTIRDPDVSVVERPDATLEVNAAAELTDITVTEPPAYAGTYTVDLAGLGIGPLNLVPPSASGSVTPGAILSATGGLWIFDTAAGTPSQSWQWQRDGLDIPGETGPSYSVVAGDEIADFQVIETQTDAFGARSAASTVLNAFSPALDNQLLGWWDASDTMTITESGGAVSAWAGKVVGADLVQSLAAQRPTTGTRMLNGLNVIDFDGSDFLEQAIALPASGNVAFHMLLAVDATVNEFEAVLAVDATNDFQIDAGSSTTFDGRLSAAGIGPGGTLSGGPYSGPSVLSVICDFTGEGTIEVFFGGVSRGTFAYGVAIDAIAALHVMTNRSQNAAVNGAVGEIVITGDVANRAAYHNYLSEKWGLL